MSEIDLSRDVQLNKIDRWVDVNFVRRMSSGHYFVEYCYGDDILWQVVLKYDVDHLLRNKPEHKVRPYTFEEARSLVGQRIRYGDTDALVVAAWPCPVRGAVIKAGELQSRSLKEALAEYTHPDGTPFGVVED